MQGRREQVVSQRRAQQRADDRGSVGARREEVGRPNRDNKAASAVPPPSPFLGITCWPECRALAAESQSCDRGSIMALVRVRRRFKSALRQRIISVLTSNAANRIDFRLDGIHVVGSEVGRLLTGLILIPFGHSPIG